MLFSSYWIPYSCAASGFTFVAEQTATAAGDYRRRPDAADIAGSTEHIVVSTGSIVADTDASVPLYIGHFARYRRPRSVPQL